MNLDNSSFQNNFTFTLVLIKLISYFRMLSTYVVGKLIQKFRF